MENLLRDHGDAVLAALGGERLACRICSWKLIGFTWFGSS
jgi:hypothetical protein